MKRTWSAVAVLLLSLTAPAAEKPDSRSPPTDQLAAIQKQHKEAEAVYYKAAEALPETPEGNKKGQTLWREFDKKQADLFLAAVDLAKANPKSDVAFAALEWVLTIPRAYYLPAGKPALELLTTHHAANPKIGKVVAWVGYYRPQQGEAQAAATELIEAVASKNPDRTARGQAVMARAWEAKSRFAVAEFRNLPDTDKLAAVAEKAFQSVLDDYADCRRLIRETGRSLGEEARQELFELRNLRIGKVAPEIEGEDLD
jgi:hypothetical protein